MLHQDLQKGFSLIEAMVAMGLGLLLLLMLVSSWMVNYRAFAQTTQLSELQQAAQFIHSLFQQEFINQQFFAGADAFSLQTVSLEAPQADCSSTVDSGSFPRLGMPFIPVRSGTVGHIDMPQCLTNAIRGSEFVQFKRLAGNPTFKQELKQNRVYLERKGLQSRFVTTQSAELSDMALYWPYIHQVFYLANQTVDGKITPVLMRKKLVRQQNGQLVMDTSSVIDGVELLHFEWAVDVDFDGQADQLQNAALIPAEVWQGKTGRVIQLRYFVLLRSLTPDRTYTNAQQYALGQRLYQAPGDAYRRLLVSSAVTFINR